jgi:hypothetical protein
VSLFRPRFLLLALGCALTPTLVGSGCAGEAFMGSDRSSGGTSAGDASELAGNAGDDSNSGQSCNGPEECDDGVACTTDVCGADGKCVFAPKCVGAQHCCGGDCAECCGNADCDDGVACTENTCFMGQCMYVPKDSQCDRGQFCSGKDGCRPRQACGVLSGEDPKTVCNDGDGCTTDSCGADNFCRHDYCTKLCCPGAAGAASSACASDCCADAQCDTDRDPCTVGSCSDGKCSLKSLCPDGQQCCPSADGKSATCGACCTAAECDDYHGCTVDQCTGNHCSHTPGDCKQPGYVCDLDKGCVPGDACKDAGDCVPKTPCQTNPQCKGGVCTFDGCTAPGTKCCKDTGCGICCSNEECNDNIACTEDACGPGGCTHTPKVGLCGKGQICDAELGCVDCANDQACDDGLACTTDACGLQNSCTHTSTCGKLKYCTSAGCVDCIRDSDCQGSVMAAAISQPGCTVQRCVEGSCQARTEPCDIGFCCPPYGCLPQCLQTQ